MPGGNRRLDRGGKLPSPASMRPPGKSTIARIGQRVDNGGRVIHDVAAIGALLFGRDWRGQLAQELGLTRRTMQRWAKEPPPPDHPCWPLLRRLITDRRRLVDEALNQGS